MAELKDIKAVIATFAKKNCGICNGTGKAGYVTPRGDGVMNVVCECAQKNYRKRMEKLVQEPCRDCGAVRSFCEHRPTRLIEYAMRKANGQRPDPKDSNSNPIPVRTGMSPLQ